MSRRKKTPSTSPAADDPNLCTHCHKPLKDRVYDDPNLQELSDFYNELLEDLTKPGYYCHRICWTIITDTSFKSMDY